MPKPVGDANPNARVRDAFPIIATGPLGDLLTLKPDGDRNATKRIKDAATKPGGDALASKSENDAVIKPIEDAIATKPNSDAVTKPIQNASLTKPPGDALAPEPDGHVNANRPIKDAATKPHREAAAAKLDGDAVIKAIQSAIATKETKGGGTNPNGDAIATKPTNYPVGPKKVAPNQQTTLAYEWQDWQYCLAPSLAEHKIYLSAPIPVSGIAASADAAFHEMLNKAGISHDEVQCPKAPNKRTLLFRQRYAIRLNEEIGNATINLNWEPHVD